MVNGEQRPHFVSGLALGTGVSPWCFMHQEIHRRLAPCRSWLLGCS